MDYIPNEHFSRTSAAEERAILGPAPENRQPAKKVPRPTGLPPYLASMYETPLLTREQEQHLFRKMNYLKHKASELRNRLDVRRPSMTAMELIEKFAKEAAAIKNDIVRANLRLVVSIAKRYASGPGHLFELISDGNMSLIRAVEKFDFARGFRFSTYATWAIMKNFARTIPTELRQQARFRTGGEERLLGIEDIRPDSARRESAQSERQSEVSRILEHLDERERQIIQHRFGLDRNRNPMTLKEVGRVMGVTKERIRQLEARAMAKLRDAVGEERVEAPEARIDALCRSTVARRDRGLATTGTVLILQRPTINDVQANCHTGNDPPRFSNWRGVYLATNSVRSRGTAGHPCESAACNTGRVRCSHRRRPPRPRASRPLPDCCRDLDVAWPPSAFERVIIHGRMLKVSG